MNQFRSKCVRKTCGYFCLNFVGVEIFASISCGSYEHGSQNALNFFAYICLGNWKKRQPHLKNHDNKSNTHWFRLARFECVLLAFLCLILARMPLFLILSRSDRNKLNWQRRWRSQDYEKGIRFRFHCLNILGYEYVAHKMYTIQIDRSKS